MQMITERYLSETSRQCLVEHSPKVSVMLYLISKIIKIQGSLMVVARCLAGYGHEADCRVIFA